MKASFRSSLVMGITLLANVLCANETNLIRVAVFDDKGAAGKGIPAVTALLGKAADIQVTKLTGEDISAGVLTNYDVVMFTGGSASRQAASLGENGREEVKRFIKNGGGYVGICAGAYLACSGFDWSLGMLNAKTISPKWRRRVGTVEIEFSETGRALSGFTKTNHHILYANGPVIKPAERTDLSAYESIAFFRTELAKNGTPEGIMVNAPAMARGAFGKGRVFISSPHPEQTDGMEAVVESAVRWTAEKSKR
jgi:glutamine amidotransferase-like uncharacterized protein